MSEIQTPPKDHHLNISEDFYSLQMEGITTGTPAYFVRLKGCNLTCGCSPKHVKQVKDDGEGNTIGGDFEGDLVQSGQATWTCDSIPVWVFGHKKPFSYLVDSWFQQSLLDKIYTGQVHVVWTGGEPTMKTHQDKIVKFLNWVNQPEMFNEIETNGTGWLDVPMFVYMDQINCSPKLANSGMAKEKRIVPEAIERIKSHPNHQFKFVVSNDEDLEEVERDFVEVFDIDPKNIVLMPGLDSRENFFERTQWVFEKAIEYGWKGITRGHIGAWDKACGV